ncbi:C40 family peptidase [Dokdonella sp.]|uniref:C40 family peptidase n=1 Tax=Dokdonella sp. TaxID=2291710 RepID=UPI0031C84991|nr:C40 family peptidase [Dokdonella sp.]
MHSRRLVGGFVLAFLLGGAAHAMAAPVGPAVVLRPAPPIDIALATRPLAQVPAVAGKDSGVTGLRELLADFAMSLRDIRYRRGGRSPDTGFDCSGFVRYVFRHSAGEDLAATSAAQYRDGASIDRRHMRTGDLVFFRTHGKRISHVGIYLDDGRFIHAPSSGKRISISRLDEPYWAKRFVGARRPDVLS